MWWVLKLKYAALGVAAGAGVMAAVFLCIMVFVTMSLRDWIYDDEE